MVPAGRPSRTSRRVPGRSPRAPRCHAVRTPRAPRRGPRPARRDGPGSTARVRAVIAASSEAGSIVPASGSTSHRTGVAPARSIAATVGTHVLAWVTPLSPRPTPSARSAEARSRRCPRRRRPRGRRPRPARTRPRTRFPRGPSTNQPLSSTRATAASRSGRTVCVARPRSAKGTFTAPRLHWRARAAAVGHHPGLQPGQVPRGDARKRRAPGHRARAHRGRRRLDRRHARPAARPSRRRSDLGVRARPRPDPRRQQGTRASPRGSGGVDQRR